MLRFLEFSRELPAGYISLASKICEHCSKWFLRVSDATNIYCNECVSSNLSRSRIVVSQKESRYENEDINTVQSRKVTVPKGLKADKKYVCVERGVYKCGERYVAKLYNPLTQHQFYIGTYGTIEEARQQVIIEAGALVKKATEAKAEANEVNEVGNPTTKAKAKAEANEQLRVEIRALESTNHNQANGQAHD